jgi:hypothetical protein
MATPAAWTMNSSLALAPAMASMKSKIENRSIHMKIWPIKQMSRRSGNVAKFYPPHSLSGRSHRDCYGGM